MKTEINFESLELAEEQKWENGLALGDGTTKFFLNAKGMKDDISAELKAFLDLVIGKAANGEYARKIEAAEVDTATVKSWIEET